MPYTIVQPRRDTPANWESNNIVLAMGETGYELTGSPLRCTAQKIGDGVTAWVDLPYAIGGYDSDVVHRTGDEIVSGQKTFADAIVSGPWIDARAYSTLAAADAAAVSTGKALLITTQWDTVPATLNAPLQFLPGGMLNNTGALTLKAPMAGNFQIFMGGGAITFSSPTLVGVPAQWWGAQPAPQGTLYASVPVASTQIQAAIDAVSRSAVETTVRLPGYWWRANVVLKNRVVLKGSGIGSTYIAPDTTASCIIFDKQLSVTSSEADLSAMGVMDLSVEGRDTQTDGNADRHGIEIHYIADDNLNLGICVVDGVRLERVGIRHMSGRGLSVVARGKTTGAKQRFVQNMEVHGCYISGCTRSGVYVSGYVIESRFDILSLDNCGSYTSAVCTPSTGALASTAADRLNSSMVFGFEYQGDDGISNPVYPARIAVRDSILNGVFDGTWRGATVYIAGGRQMLFERLDMEGTYTAFMVDATSVSGTKTVWDVVVNTVNCESPQTLHAFAHLKRLTKFTARNITCTGTAAVSTEYPQAPTTPNAGIPWNGLVGGDIPSADFGIFIEQAEYSECSLVDAKFCKFFGSITSKFLPSTTRARDIYDPRGASLGSTGILLVTQPGCHLMRGYNGVADELTYIQRDSGSTFQHGDEIVLKIGGSYPITLTKTTLAAGTPPVIILSDAAMTTINDTFTLAWNGLNKAWVEKSRMLF